MTSPTDSSRPAAPAGDTHAELLELRESVKQLKVLNEVALALSNSSDLSQVLTRLVEMSVHATGAEHGAIWLLQEGEDPLKTMVRQNAPGYTTLNVPMFLRLSLKGWVTRHNATLEVEDLASDSRFHGIAPHVENIRSVLAAPVRLQDKLIGVLALFNKRSGRFTAGEEKLLAILGTQSAQTIEGVQSAQREREQEAMKKDIELAKLVQEGILPKSDPAIPGYEIAGRNVSARGVGGDSFSYIPMAGGKLAISIADVSGKGVAAALLMTNLHATLRCLAPVHSGPASCVRAVNTSLAGTMGSGRFATLFFGELDPLARRFRYCNAGHNFPLLLRASGAVEELQAGGLPVGVMSDWQYEEGSVDLAQGDILLIYSDGITEAENGKQEQFGEELLEQQLRAFSKLPAPELVNQLLARVDRFSAGVPQTDDQTVVVVRVP